MKASKEHRRWVDGLRRRYGKKNGCIPVWAWDNPSMERKLSNSKKVKPAELESAAVPS